MWQHNFQRKVAYLCSNQFVLVSLPHWTGKVGDVRGKRFIWLLVLFGHLNEQRKRMSLLKASYFRTTNPIQPEFRQWTTTQGAKRIDVEVAWVTLPEKIQNETSNNMCQSYNWVHKIASLFSMWHYVGKGTTSETNCCLSHEFVGTDRVEEVSKLTIREATTVWGRDAPHRRQEERHFLQVAWSAVVVRSLGQVPEQQ